MWPNPQFLADLVTFTEEILNGKLHFLCSASSYSRALYFNIPGLIFIVLLCVVDGIVIYGVYAYCDIGKFGLKKVKSNDQVNLLGLFRSGCWQIFHLIDILKSSAKFIEKDLWYSHKSYSVNFAKVFMFVCFLTVPKSDVIKFNEKTLMKK